MVGLLVYGKWLCNIWTTPSKDTGGSKSFGQHGFTAKRCRISKIWGHVMYFTFRFYLLGHLFSSKFQSICPAEFFSHFQKWLWFFGENFWFLKKLEKSWKTCEEYLLTVIWWWSHFLKILILKFSPLQWKFWKIFKMFQKIILGQKPKWWVPTNLGDVVW